MKIIQFLSLILFSNILFSQSDTLKPQEIGMYFQNRVFSQKSILNIKNIQSQAVGIEYRVFTKDVYFFKARLSYIYNYNYTSTELDKLYYNANVISNNIGFMVKLLKDNRAKPYIGLLYVSSFIYNEELSINYYAYEGVDKINVKNNYRYNGNFALNIGVNVLVIKDFTFNMEASYYFGNYFDYTYSEKHTIKATPVEFNFGIGYRL